MIIPVIIAGGRGQRLWPCSTDARPKPFISLAGETTTLFQKTLERLRSLPDCGPPIIVCHADQEPLARTQAEAAGTSDPTFLLEPASRNTSAAICSAALAIEKRYSENATMLVLPADHAIRNLDAFATAVSSGAELAADNRLVTFAVKPNRPATGYGYLKMGDAINIDARQFLLDGFIEKPDAEKAEALIASGRYAWNSGIFIFKAKSLLENFDAFEPEILRCCRNALPDDAAGPVVKLKPASYDAVPSLSIDYAIMEKAGNIATVYTEFGWGEVGDWGSAWHASDKDSAGVAASGDIRIQNCHNCIMSSDGPRLICEHLKGMIVIRSQGALLIAPLERAQDVKNAAQIITESGAKGHPLFSVEANMAYSLPVPSLGSLHLFIWTPRNADGLAITLTPDTLQFENAGTKVPHITQICVK